MRIILILLFICHMYSSQAQKGNNTSNSPLLQSLLNRDTLLQELIKNKDAYRLQIIYTAIDRDKNNSPSFTPHYFNVNSNTYFYPASTAKMPVAFLALQKLNEIKIKGLSKYTTMLVDSASPMQTKVIGDASSKDGHASIANYIKKIFLVSDNDANNRVYEFLGQAYINNNLHKMGYTNAQVLHRLGVSLSEAENRHTKTIRFNLQDGKTVYNQPAQYSNLPYQKRNDYVGKGYYKNDSLINAPFNFSLKNKLVLPDLTKQLLSVLFPYSFKKAERFNLSQSDYKFLYQYLSQLPTEQQYPIIDSTEKYDAYCKFLLYGANANTVIPKHIRIFNKIGVAYGFVADVAYIVDFEKNIEFALSATIYVNEDGILNDDKYEYEKIAYPFMKNLGEVIYKYELQRNRTYKPNLSKFVVDYTK